MSFELPTAAELKARFPAFAEVDDDVVTDVINETKTSAGTHFVTEADVKLARLLYAAHTLTLDGFGGSTEAELSQNGLMGFQSVTSGRLSFTRGANGVASSNSTLDQTQYGRRYKEILARNVGGPVIGATDA